MLALVAPVVGVLAELSNRLRRRLEAAQSRLWAAIDDRGQAQTAELWSAVFLAIRPLSQAEDSFARDLP